MSSGEGPAPAALGRGVVVRAGAPAPAAWADAPRVEIDESVLSAPAAAVERLHALWSERSPVVVSLAVDPTRFRLPEAMRDPVHSLGPDLDLPLDRLHHLVWANNYDARGEEPVWWWAEKAVRAGADHGGAADVIVDHSADAWIDGGPRWSVPHLPEAVVHAQTVEAGFLDPVPADPPPPASALAPDQLAAVSHHGGPVRVIAPAGSGKTRVLTERMRHLLADRGYRREEVIAYVQAHNLFRAPPVLVEHFTLYSSRLGKEQAVYVPEVDYELA